MAGGLADWKVKNAVPLTSVLFVKRGKRMPSKLKLTDCSIGLVHPIKGAVSALYGYQNKADALSCSAQYADKHDLDMHVVEFKVVLDKHIDPKMLALSKFDATRFMSLSRIAKDTTVLLAEYWQEWLEKEDSAASRRLRRTLDWTKGEEFVGARPDLLEKFFKAEPRIHLVAHPAQTTFSDQKFVVGTFLPGKVKAVVDASVRLAEYVKIIL
jgi:hypothetical protein